MQQHFFGISGKEDNIARKVYRNFREFFTGKFPKFSLEWFAFRKFNSFQIYRKHFQKFPCHYCPLRNCRNFWLNRKPRPLPPLLPSFSATVPPLVFVAVVAVWIAYPLPLSDDQAPSSVAFERLSPKKATTSYLLQLNLQPRVYLEQGSSRVFHAKFETLSLPLPKISWYS